MEPLKNNSAQLANPGIGAQAIERKVGEVESLIERATVSVANLESEVELLVARLLNILPNVPDTFSSTVTNQNATPRITQHGVQLDSINSRIDRVASIIRTVHDQLEN